MGWLHTEGTLTITGIRRWAGPCAAPVAVGLLLYAASGCGRREAASEAQPQEPSQTDARPTPDVRSWERAFKEPIRLAMARDGSLLAVASVPPHRWPEKERHGSTVSLLDSAGEVLWERKLAPRERVGGMDGLPGEELLAALEGDGRAGVRRVAAGLRSRAQRRARERRRIDAMLERERALWEGGVSYIAGIDEVGVGPFAGPVVAAAVVFSPGAYLEGVRDSKRLNHEQRMKLDGEIRRTALGVGVGLVDVESIAPSMRECRRALPRCPPSRRRNGQSAGRTGCARSVPGSRL